MSLFTPQFFGILAILIVLLANVIYIREALTTSVRPERATWLIWTTLNFIFLFTQFAEGANESIWGITLDAIMSLGILLVAWRVDRTKLPKRDRYALVFAAITLIIWFLTDNAFLALLLAIAIDSTGFGLTIYKTALDHTSESLNSWTLYGLSSIFSALAVGEMDWKLLIFHFYVLTGSIILITLMLRGRYRERSA